MFWSLGLGAVLVVGRWLQAMGADWGLCFFLAEMPFVKGDSKRFQLDECQYIKAEKKVFVNLQK